MGICDFTVYDFICNNAKFFPNRYSVVSNDVRLTHKEFKERCDKVAAGLSRSGITKGDRIGIVAHNCDEFMVLYGAAAKIGAILLPVNWRLQQSEVEYILKDCNPKVVFAGSEYREMITEMARKVKSIENCYTIGGGEVSEGFLPFEGLYSGEKANKEIHISADSGFVIIHTAAMESHPRGALLSQANIIFINLMSIQQYHLGPDDCNICILPLFHAAGIVTAMAVMHAGGKNVVVEAFDPELTLQLIQKERGTIFFNFSPILKMIMDRYDKGSYDISSIRNVMGLDSPENIRRFLNIVPEAKYWSGYAQTEAMDISTCLFDEKPSSVGKSSLLTRVVLLDNDEKEVPVGTPGEICVHSPAVFCGYWGKDDDSAYTFRNGWHHTGDIGVFNEEGYLYYVKRKAEKELIKTGGENVYPAEVEKVILDHECVAETCVIGVPDTQWGEAIKAICVIKPGRSLDSGELINFVASKIARYKKPKYVVYVDALPKTDDGEIDRDQVRKEFGGKL
jgi:acyl-CoA synthetase (AMP-forming)/AMP-acid ligase II